MDKIVCTSIFRDTLIIQASAAELIIQRSQDQWLVKWRVGYIGLDQFVSGQVVFSHDDLIHAFLVDGHIEKTAGWMISQYGGSSAVQGKFIRYKEFLNIPGPGTGHDGDANISIEISDAIREAVEKLVYDCKT
ncbi:MAG TPA: hypothetical protein VG866_02240 [Candidatus Paceibacterota bacterium]|nr:hypothetical protein [Candidatus Paceibacterota bacterium]